MAAGFKANRTLIDALTAEGRISVYEAGGYMRPRKIFDAIHEGHLAAKLLA